MNIKYYITLPSIDHFNYPSTNRVSFEIHKYNYYCEDIHNFVYGFIVYSKALPEEYIKKHQLIESS